MSNRKKLPRLGFHPNHVLMPSIRHHMPLHGHQLAREVAGCNISNLIARGMVDDRKPAATTVSNSYPPQEIVGCHAFYMANGRDPKILFGFLVGASPKEDLNLKMVFSLDKPPFNNKKREFKPTSKIMQQEVLRRASLQGTSRMPRPAQWSTEKLHEALSLRFPPKMTLQDILFLRIACKEVYDEAMKRKEEELSSNEEKKDNSIRWPQGEGWKNPKAMLRLYHMLVNLREIFVSRNQSGKSSVNKFWAAAADRYNNATWIPSSAIIPKLESFELSTLLPLTGKKLTATELVIIFGGMKPKLREIVEEWNRSFKPTEMVNKNGIVEQWDYATLVNRLGSREAVDSHVMYLWEFANNNQILGSCLLPVEGEPETSAEAASFSRTAADEKTKAPVLMEDIVQAVEDHEHEEESDESEEELQILEPPQKVTEATVVREEAAIAEPEAEEPEAVVERKTEEPRIESLFDIGNFTASQQLHFEHLKVYNGVENELFELQVKAVSAKTSAEKKLYQLFAWRKKKILDALILHLERSTAYVARLSQSLGIPPVKVAALPYPELDDDISVGEGAQLSSRISRQPKTAAQRPAMTIEDSGGKKAASPPDERGKESHKNVANATRPSPRKENSTISDDHDSTEEDDAEVSEEKRVAANPGEGETEGKVDKADPVAEEEDELQKAAAVAADQHTTNEEEQFEDADDDPIEEGSNDTSPQTTGQTSLKMTIRKDGDDNDGAESTSQQENNQKESSPQEKEVATISPRSKTSPASKEEDTSRRATRRTQVEAPTRQSGSRDAPQVEESAKKKRRTK